MVEGRIFGWRKKEEGKRKKGEERRKKE